MTNAPLKNDLTGEGRCSLRSDPWRYIRYPDGEEELYDHRTDPHELRNLAKDPASETLRAGFRKQLSPKWGTSLGGRQG